MPAFSHRGDNRGVTENWITWSPARGAVAACVVAHGAGNDSHTPFLDGVAEGLVAGRVSCLRFDFPYTRVGKRAPDRPPVLLSAWREALGVAAQRAKGLPLVASGKSLGGRIASLLAAEEGEAFAARALVFFGYPLHAPGRSDAPRTEHLARVTVPMLFIEGTADPLARFDLVEETVRSLGKTARLHTVEGGDHSFRVRGRKRPDEEIGRELGATAADFIRDVTGSG
jgi:predicted alpha/beta-hydrolase family hydrolase